MKHLLDIHAPINKLKRAFKKNTEKTLSNAKNSTIS